MGARDLYPFVLSTEVLRKLDFIRDLVQDGARQARVRAPSGATAD
jgi:hypothetical protein